MPDLSFVHSPTLVHPNQRWPGFVSRAWRAASLTPLLCLIWIVAPTAAIAQQAGHALAIMPRTSGGGGTEELFTLDLENGRSQSIQVRRDPLEVRLRPFDSNLFQEIGRPAGQPGQSGEIHLMPIHQGDGSIRAALFVEASTGYTAYFEQIGRGGRFGRIVTTIGRTSR